MAGTLTPYHSTETAVLYHGDCLEVMMQLEPNSVDCIVTSPPYAMQRASTYGGIQEKDYPEWQVAVFDAAKVALKPEGSILWNISPHVRKGNMSDYVLRSRLAVREAGWYEHDELVWYKPGAMPCGRNNWPVRAWEPIYWYSRTANPFADATAAGNKISDEMRKRVARNKNPFGGREVRNGWDHRGRGVGKMGNEFARSKNVVQIPTAAMRGKPDHPAPYPEQLASWLIKMFCPAGGIVLDPFAGSGTTAVAAGSLGYISISIELNESYLDMIARRTAPVG